MSLDKVSGYCLLAFGSSGIVSRLGGRSRRFLILSCASICSRVLSFIGPSLCCAFVFVFSFG